MLELMVLVLVALLLGGPLALLAWYSWREKSWGRRPRRD